MMKKYIVDILLVALSALLIQVTLAKPLNKPQTGVPANQTPQQNPVNAEPEAELEDLRTLTGNAEQPGVGVPLRGPKPAIAAPPLAQAPQRVAAPISDANLFQGAKQALRTAAAQVKQQQQQPQQAQQQQQQPVNPPYIDQHDAVEAYTDLDMNLDLTPKAVAEYLLITGDFQGFDSAIADLLNANIIKAEEAREYKDAVGWEYEALLKKLVDAKQEYLKEVLESMDPTSTTGEKRAAPAEETSETTLSQPVVPQEGTSEMDAVDLSMALRKLQLKSLLEKEATLDELLQAIVEEYLLKGMETGNVPDTAPKASVKINPEEEQLEQMMELMAEAVRQGTQTNTQQQQQAAKATSENDAEEELSQIAAQTNRQEQTQPAQNPAPVSNIEKPEAEPITN